MNVFLDMDGVLCDFISSVLHKASKPVSYNSVKEESLNAVIPKSEVNRIWKIIHKQRSVFWEKLEPTPFVYAIRDSYDDLFRSHYNNLYILSSPIAGPASAQGKMKWLRNHMPFLPASNIILTASKHLLSHEGNILVDDRLSVAAEFTSNERKGECIVFPQPWNCDNFESLSASSQDTINLIKEKLKC